MSACASSEMVTVYFLVSTMVLTGMIILWGVHISSAIQRRHSHG